MSTVTQQRSKTTNEKKAQAEALHNSISDQVEQLRDSGRWEAFLKFAEAFHAYSLNNLLLIWSQNPDASQVAGFRKWQALGRQVRKGETGLRIFGYSTKKIIEKDERGDDVEKRSVRFPILSVFDIGQTDLIEGADDSSTITQQLTGIDDFGIIRTLSTYLADKGWTVDRRSLSGVVNGYTRPENKTIVIDSTLSPEAAAKTIIHETAHILLAHIENMAEYIEHRGLMETEAESVAYVVAGMIGFDSSAYSIGYIAGWADGDSDLIKYTAGRVLRTVHEIATILDPTSNDEANID